MNKLILDVLHLRILFGLMKFYEFRLIEWSLDVNFNEADYGGLVLSSLILYVLKKFDGFSNY